MNPDGLDLGPQGAVAGQARDEGELHRGDYVLPQLRHQQDVGRIAVDGAKRPQVGDQVLSRIRAVPRGAELVSGDQVHGRGKVIGLRPAQHNG
jgi:hypothetical protein